LNYIQYTIYYIGHTIYLMIRTIEGAHENSPIIHIMCDLIGNIFIKSIRSDAKNSKINSMECDSMACDSMATYYWLSMTDGTPELVSLVKSYHRFRKNYIDHIGMRNQITCGRVIGGKSTLKGVAMNGIDRMDDEKRSDMDFNNFDNTFIERSYYNIQRDQMEDTDDDMDRMDPDGDLFYLNGCVDDLSGGIQHAPIMMTSPGSFDTLLIDGPNESKNVISTIERIDGCCVYRATIYTDGNLKINIVGSSIAYYKFIHQNDQILIIPSDRAIYR